MAEKIIIEFLSGSRRGERLELDVRDRVTFGRHPGNDVAFDAHKDLEASARHAELVREAAGYVLVDKQSSNGTFLGQTRVERLNIRLNMDYDVEFGEGGPRCKLFVGEPEAMALPATMIGNKRSGPFLAPTISPPKKEPKKEAKKEPPTGSLSIMLRRALHQARDQQQQGQGPNAGRSTTFMKAMMDQALHRSTRRFKFVLVGTTTLFMATIVVVLVLSKRTDASLAGVAPVEETRPETIVVTPLGPTETVDDRMKIFDDNRLAIYLIAYDDPSGESRPICSAFAVTREVLATNAHCIESMRDVEKQTGADGNPLTAYAVRNHAPKRYDIAWRKWHPEYEGPFSPDVALLGVKGTMEAVVKMAPAEHLVALRPPMDIYVFGFPGAAADVAAPEASVFNGIISRVTQFSGGPGADATAFLVQHTAATSRGTSGSPVFNQHGEVIAVNEGARKERHETEDGQQVAVAAPGLGLAVRIDALYPVLDERVSGWRASLGSEATRTEGPR